MYNNKYAKGITTITTTTFPFCLTSLCLHGYSRLGPGPQKSSYVDNGTMILQAGRPFCCPTNSARY